MDSDQTIDLGDPDTPLEERLRFAETEDGLDLLIGQYEDVQSKPLEEVMFNLALSERLGPMEKYRVLSTLYSCSEDRKTTENVIAAFIPNSAVIEFTTVKWLLSLDPEGETHLPRLYKYLSNKDLQESTRYNQVFSLREDYPTQVKEGMKYLYTQSLSSRYRVICAQYLLENNCVPPFSATVLSTGPSETDRIFRDLLQIAENPQEEYNVRADAADALHHYSSGDMQERAFATLRELGGKTNNLYENKQNIHSVDVSEGMNLIAGIEPTEKYADIIKRLRDRGDSVKVAASIGRISLDMARYGKEKLNSEQIFERIWAYIQKSPSDRPVLEKRLIEELEEMADTCSSGHAIRLLNVLSGFGADVRISFEDQIKSNFTGRMNARLRKIADEKERDKVLTEMVDFGKTFMKYFTQYQGSIVDELREEFVPDFVTSDEFDAAILRALAPYEKRWDRVEEDIEFKSSRK